LENARGCHSSTRCCSTAPMAEVEASVTIASGAVGSGAPVNWRVTTHLALFKGPVEIRRPRDWMRALDSGTGESVI
jgi:hypothetical protein